MKLVITRINNDNITTWKDDCRNLEFMLNDHYREFCHDENRYEPAGRMSEIIYVSTNAPYDTLKVYMEDNIIDVFVFEDHDDFKDTHKLLTEFGKHYDFEVEQFESYESYDDLPF